MKPVLFEIGGFEFYSYAVLFCFAFALVIIWSLRVAPRYNIDTDNLYDILIITIVLAVVGSRVAFVILHWDHYQLRPWWEIFAFRQGGLTFLGGMILVLIGNIIYCYIKKIDFLYLLDFATPFITIGYAITRIGCFLNGCCYGVITDKPWGVVFPALGPYPRHPTQLYSSAALLIMFFVLRYIKRYSYFRGFMFTSFLLMYGIYRFFIEFVRVDIPILWFLRTGQIAALVLIILAGGFLFWKKKKLYKRGIGGENLWTNL